MRALALDPGQGVDREQSLAVVGLVRHVRPPPRPGARDVLAPSLRNGSARRVEGAEHPAARRAPACPSSASRSASDAVFGVSFGAEAAVAAAGDTTGTARRSRRGSPGRGTGVPWATVTQTLPRRLHSTQTLYAGIRGGGPAGTRPSTSSSWPRVDRAAAQLEVHVDVGGDRRRGRQGADVRRGGRRPTERELRRRRRSCAAPGCRRGGAGTDRDQAPGHAGGPRWIRSASSGVVIDPSTRDRS